MNFPRHIRSAVPGITAGAFIALWIWPATRWLIQAQLVSALPARTLIGVSCPAGFEPEESTPGHNEAVEIATHNPSDYLLQLAAAVPPNATSSRLSAAATVKRLRAMETGFPDRPSVYANALRFASHYDVVIERNEPAILVGDPTLAHDVSGTRPTASLEQLAAFDRDASI